MMAQMMAQMMPGYPPWMTGGPQFFPAGGQSPMTQLFGPEVANSATLRILSTPQQLDPCQQFAALPFCRSDEHSETVMADALAKAANLCQNKCCNELLENRGQKTDQLTFQLSVMPAPSDSITGKVQEAYARMQARLRDSKVSFQITEPVKAKMSIDFKADWASFIRAVHEVQEFIKSSGMQSQSVYFKLNGGTALPPAQFQMKLLCGHYFS
jgi:hypothetical protein